VSKFLCKHEDVCGFATERVAAALIEVQEANKQNEIVL
jgi:hypothetical protein